MKLYKLTDKDGYTRRGKENECLWGENVSHSGTGSGPLCSEGWVHAYTDPLVAVFMNPAHANIREARLWEAEGEIAINDNSLKVGCKTLTTIREIPCPVLTTEQRVATAILISLATSVSDAYRVWAEGWLSGADRSWAASINLPETIREAIRRFP